MFDDPLIPPLSEPERDGVDGLDSDEPPTVVSVSDVHGYLQPARSALLTLADHPDFDPVVTMDPAEGLQWTGGEEFVLVFNGDLFDRGPDNDAVAAMVARLARQAPEGHVRVTLGNHEMGVLVPDCFGWDYWYSGKCDTTDRRAFIDRVHEGLVVAGYEGHNVTYAHAGRPEPYEVGALNDDFAAAAGWLGEAAGTEADAATQRDVIAAFPEVLGMDGRTGRGPGAGVAWLDFEHMPADAPPQVVGHTRQDRPRRKGDVICQNTIRSTNRREGGEAAVVETPDRLAALARDPRGGVRVYGFAVP